MSENKTQETNASVEDFLAGIENPKRQSDTRAVVDIMMRVTGFPAKMWGAQLIGFDTYHYKYASGREGDFLIVGVAPRKTSLSLHIMNGFDAYPELMENLGKYKTGVSCLYINKLEDVDQQTLEELIRRSVTDMRAKYPR